MNTIIKEVVVKEQEGRVSLSVSDNGTGLGLSIVKHAVQYHHGKMSVESELDQGTTISIQFDV